VICNPEYVFVSDVTHLEQEANPSSYLYILTWV
jgi:hypothetical protein